MIGRLISAARSRWAHLPANLRGALWILLAAFLLTAMGGVVKRLGHDIHPLQMVFFRSLIGAIVMVPFMLRTGLAGLKTTRPGMHLLRTVVGVTGMFCVFYAFSHLPLAETVAIVFSRPLFAVVLAAWLLKETVGWQRTLAAVAGFAGVLIMVRPGTAAFDPASLVAVLAACTAGSIAIIIKKLAATERTATIVMWFSGGSALIAFIPSLFVWVWPTPLQWAELILVGVVGVAGQAAMTRGFSTGETSFVTPFDYSRLIYATLIGFVFFAEVPDAIAILGALIIVGSGYTIARGELAANRARRRAEAAAVGAPADGAGMAQPDATRSDAAEGRGGRASP